MAKATIALKTLCFIADFEVVQIFASRVLARLEGSTIFATFGPGGPGGGAPCNRGAYRLAAWVLKGNFDLIRT